LPRFLERIQVEKLLKSCDRRVGGAEEIMRSCSCWPDWGLRAGEVLHLTLDDIDWGIGELRIRGKGARLDRLPLPEDVGKALADYLKKGATGLFVRRVFVHRNAPHGAWLAIAQLAVLVRAALTRAGLHPHYRGSHLLRHSLATRMLRGGASLAQIGQVLRHQHAQTTEIYAKVDLNALASFGAALARRCAMNTLTTHLDNYLRLRRQLGFKLRGTRHSAPQFLCGSHKKSEPPSSLTALALEWATQPLHLKPIQKANRLGMVRRFAKHLSAIDPRTEVPAAKTAALPVSSARPSSLRAQDILGLIEAARQMDPTHPIKGASYGHFDRVAGHYWHARGGGHRFGS